MRLPSSVGLPIAGTLMCAALSTAPPVAAAATPATPLGSLVAVAGTAPTHLLQSLGAASLTSPARALIALGHRDEAGLLRFDAAVSDPHSASYRHFLTQPQFVARYAPAATTVSRLESYLQGFGLQVAAVPSNRAYVLVTGNVAQMDSAFATSIVRVALGGQLFQAPSSALSLPRALAGAVTGIEGLDTTAVAHPMAGLETPPSPAYVNSPPMSSYWGSSTSTAPDYNGHGPFPDVNSGYTPAQVEGAYGISGAISGGLNGAGQTVAVIDAYSSPTLTSDVDQWSQLNGLPQPHLVINDNALERDQPEGIAIPSDVPILGGVNLLDPQGWFGEETLDVEAVHTTAPDATIIVQGALSAEDADLHMAENAVVNANQAQIISNSYGGAGDGSDPTADGYWQQAMAQGQGVYFSSGDEGDNTTGGTDVASRATDEGANSPFVTSVGGTTLAIGAHDNYEWETYWGTQTATLTGGTWGPLSFSSGGGGGTTEYYTEPTWQKGVVPDKFANYWQGNKNAISKPALPGRVVPDVAMLGDPNAGFLMGQTQDFTAYGNVIPNYDLPHDDDHFGEYRIGGTSLSSPLFAGMMALADQASGSRHGFANPALYALNGSHAFHDITAPGTFLGVVRTNFTNNTNAKGGTETLLRTLGNTFTLTSQPGYDDSTGLGSPNGLAFLSALAPKSPLVASLERAFGGNGTGTASGSTGRTGNVRVKTCAPAKSSHCSVQLRTATVVSTPTRATARLTRGRTVFAVGTAQHGRLTLTARRPLKPGRYTLVLITRKGSHTVTTKRRITLR